MKFLWDQMTVISGTIKKKQQNWTIQSEILRDYNLKDYRYELRFQDLFFKIRLKNLQTNISKTQYCITQ